MNEEVARAERIAHALGAFFVETRSPTVVIDPEGRIAAANRAAVQQYGYPLEELVTLTIADLRVTPPKEDELNRVIAGEIGPVRRRSHRRKDGTVFWTIPTLTPMTLDGATYVAAVLEDATPSVDAERSARDVIEANLRDRQLILNAVMGMLGEPELEPALQILARVFGQAIGKGTTVWLPEREAGRVLRAVAFDGLSDADLARIQAARLELDRENFARNAWETGVGASITISETNEGSFERLVTERIVGRGIVVPLVGRNGPHGLVYTIAREDDLARAVTLATTLGTFGGMIIEAVQLEARAKTHAARAQVMWQAASERLTDGIALLDADRRIVRVNSAERGLLMREEYEIIGRRCDEVFTPCIGHPRCAHVVALEEKRRVVQEIYGSRTGKPLRNEVIPSFSNEASIAIIHVTHDLTEERAIRSQLVTTDRLAAIGRLAAGVAHEINNPAAFVTVNLGVLRDRFLAGTARTQDVAAILEESLNGMERIREIVRDLKGFARERANELVDLGQIVQSAIRMAAHETRGRAAVERVAGDAVTARVRGARIAQVVLNLIVNAAQAIPAGKPRENRIVVRTRRAGDKVRVEVADTGPGIDPGIADRIFEPFFTTREPSGGTGLGLWLARGIVEEEGGTLTFQGEPGGGACFVVELPGAAPSSGGATNTGATSGSAAGASDTGSPGGAGGVNARGRVS